MDIHTASLYMEHGYKVKRPSWDAGEYIHKFCGLIEKCTVENTLESFGLWVVYAEDLSVTDWELILEDENVV
jgi:hypothetical protein